ncbi:MAG TPA: hypothetical protein VJP76_05245, partial [Candidatus Tumulicola sp.]|nr:hypothetical protein [Candidatus Tumulicola sp.]
LYPAVHELFSIDSIVVLKGRLRLRERRGTAPGEESPLELSVGVNEASAFVPGRRRAPAPRAWHVDVMQREQIDRLAALLEECPGDVPVVMHARGRIQRAARAAGSDERVRSELERIFGAAGVREGAPEETVEN